MITNSKIAFITGANRGLGLETAKQLAKLGIKTIIGSRDLAQGQEAAANLKKLDLDVECLQFDVTSIADHVKAKDLFSNQYGKLDILVNNAGVFLDSSEPTHVALTENLNPEILRNTFDANFFAPVQLTLTLLPLIKKSAAGRIVNLSSILGSLALHADKKSPIYNSKHFAYDSSKTALNAFTINMAYELRNTSVKINSAHPGWVKTDMGGPQASLKVEDGAKTTVRLATLDENGPSGGFFHLNETLPW